MFRIVEFEVVAVDVKWIREFNSIGLLRMFRKVQVIWLFAQDLALMLRSVGVQCLSVLLVIAVSRFDHFCN